MNERQLNELQQLVGDLNEIITFKIDDDEVRDNAKRLIRNIENLIDKVRK